MSMWTKSFIVPLYDFTQVLICKRNFQMRGQFKLHFTNLNCTRRVLIECGVYSREGSNTVHTDLHGTWDTLSIAEDLPQVFGAQNICQWSLSQQPFFMEKNWVAHIHYSLQALRAWILEFDTSVPRICEFDPFCPKIFFCRKTLTQTDGQKS